MSESDEEVTKWDGPFQEGAVETGGGISYHRVAGNRGVSAAYINEGFGPSAEVAIFTLDEKGMIISEAQAPIVRLDEETLGADEETIKSSLEEVVDTVVEMLKDERSIEEIEERLTGS